MTKMIVLVALLFSKIYDKMLFNILYMSFSNSALQARWLCIQFRCEHYTMYVLRKIFTKSVYIVKEGSVYCHPFVSIITHIPLFFIK